MSRMTNMNELGCRVCDVLELPKHLVTSVQLNDAVNELPTATVTFQIWPDDMAKIINPK